MDKFKNTWAILAAAGSGQRLREATAGVSKQFMLWKQKPLYWHSLMVLARFAPLKGIVLALPPSSLEDEKKRIEKLSKADDPGVEILVIPGGASRQESVRVALEAVPLSCDRVIVHDAARPFLTPGLLWRVCDALESDSEGIVPAIAVTDTIKLVNCGGQVESTLPRERLRAVQTPQVFLADVLRNAHKLALQDGITATDDASLLEMTGHSVRIVTGDADNVKITNPEDLALLATAEMKNYLPCVGFGYDVHKFGSDKPLRLGGVEVPGKCGLIAHSDGDVLLHALMDAILGSAGLGDIGTHFPDTDPALAGISSAILLDETLRLARERNVEIRNADITVVAQMPRLEPWKTEISNNVSRLLDLPKNRVNIKATTEEGMGFTGSGEGIKVYAIVSGTILQ